MDFQQETIDRLARLETKTDELIKKFDEHSKRHWEVSIRTMLAVLGAALALVVSVLR